MQQKKVGDSPSYEHLSRPYLEKMKFLDNFIQPRKSYRNVSIFPGGGASSMQHMFDGNESSRSSSSAKMTAPTNGHGKNDVDDVLSQFYHMNQFTHAMVKHEENEMTPLRDAAANKMPSSSSSIVSQASPATMLSNGMHTNEMDETLQVRKRRRTATSIIDSNGMPHSNHLHQTDTTLASDNDDDVDGEDEEEERNASSNNDDATGHQPSPIPTDFLYPFYQQQQQQQRSLRKSTSNEHTDAASSTFPNPGDFFHTLYQQAAVARQTRTSEQLLGELVTTELLKMSKDRKKIAQKKILEILFFDDDWLIPYSLIPLNSNIRRHTCGNAIQFNLYIEVYIAFHFQHTQFTNESLDLMSDLILINENYQPLL